MPANPPPLDAAARDALARKDLLSDASLEDFRSFVWYHAFPGPRRDRMMAVIAALIAQARAGGEDTARLRGLERYACVIETRTSEGYQERFERDSDEEFADWLDFVIANTDANQQDELSADAARSPHPETPHA